jgi:hypothetical protein
LTAVHSPTVASSALKSAKAREESQLRVTGWQGQVREVAMWRNFFWKRLKICSPGPMMLFGGGGTFKRCD